MSRQKKNILWFTLYGILITVVFLHVLFPSDIVKSRLEEAANSSGLMFKSESVKPALPLGLKFKGISLGSASSDNIPFQGEWLDFQFNPLSLFQKSKSIGLSGKAYGGKLKGRLAFGSFSSIYPPKEGNLNLQDIDLSKYAYLKNMVGREITGKAKGSLIFGRESTTGHSSSTFSIVITRGTYPLLEPFLGMNRVDFDVVEIKARLVDGVLNLEKFVVSGPQIRCSFKGEIMLADIFKNSQLNLNGEMEITGPNKAKMNVTIGGTLANPELRYI